MRATLRVAALAIATAIAAAGCTRGRTQIIVVVETDLPRTAYSCFGLVVSRITADGVDPNASRQFLAVPIAAEPPFSFGVTPPDGDARARVEIAVEALPTCEDPRADQRIVRRAARTGFIEATSLRLPLFLPASCGEGCVPSLSCPATGPDCEVPPTIAATDLEPVTPMTELADAGAPSIDAGAPAPDASIDTGGRPSPDSGPRGDAGPPPPCTPTPMVGVMAAMSPVSYSLAALHASGEFAALADIGSGIAWQSFEVDGSMPVGRTPLSTGGTGAWGIVSVTTPGTDDQIVAVWRASSSRVDRYVIPGGMVDTSTPNLLMGSLRERGIGCAMGSDALVLHDEQGLGDPLVARRVSRTGSASVVYRDTAQRPAALASRASGGALIALGDDTTNACEVVAISAAGSAGSPRPITVEGTCAAVAITERSDGVVVLAYVHGTPTRASYVALDGTTLDPLGPPVDLGEAVSGRMSATSGAAGVFRITWQDSTALTSRALDPDGTVRSTQCLTAAGADYTAHRSAHVGTISGVLVLAGRSLSFAGLPD